MDKEIKDLSGEDNLTALEHPAGVLMFLPMLYVAWADDILTPEEFATINSKIKEQEWLDESEKSVLKNWLDPSTPPTAETLMSWLRVIRYSASEISKDSKKTLTDLGLEIARLGAKNDFVRCSTPEACKAIEEIEESLGIVSYEASADILFDRQKRELIPERERESRFDSEAMKALLDGKNAEIRNKLRKFLSQPEFDVSLSMNKEEYREKVLEWVNRIAQQGIGALSFPAEYGGEENPSKFIAAFETIAYRDLSMAVKFGVQFGLFAGSIYELGTKSHHDQYLSDAGSLKLSGCFAMTETGHGSNVRDIETTAVYDKDNGHFIVNTPSESARKDYIGNAADHGKLATVFAQLIVGGENYGVHALLVPIRDEEGKPQNGVRIEDCGEKLGLNGVDNGRIWFDHVEVPRENLLDRFASVSKEGIYSSPIASSSKRFFTMLGTLVGGRISVAAAGLSAAKSAVVIATRYASYRRQFGQVGGQESKLMEYPTHQRRIMPLIAHIFALDFALKYLKKRYINRTDTDTLEVEALAAGIKAYATWNTTETIQICREACGGQGYLAENRFAALKADADVFTTFEGDNTVLLQLVAKGLLSGFSQQFQDMKFFGIVKYIANQAAITITELNPVVTRLTDEEHLRDPDFHLGAFRYREQDLLRSAARRLKKRIDNGISSYSAFIECQTHVINMAKAYVERVILEQFLTVVKENEKTPLYENLKSVYDLFTLSTIEKNKGWYLEHGYLEGVKTKAIRKQVDKLSRELSFDAEGLVNSFGIPDEILSAPIAVSSEN